MGMKSNGLAARFDRRTAALVTSGTIFPSGDQTGVTDTQLMQAAINAGYPLSLIPDAIYWTDQNLVLPNRATIRFGRSSRLKRCTSFAATIQLVAGSTAATISGTAGRIVRQYAYLSGQGLSRPCRVEAIAGQTVTLTRPAKATGTFPVTVHPGHNVLFTRNTDGVQVYAPEGIGYIDGNLAASIPWINASLDAIGSGFRFEGAANWWMDKIKLVDHHYHGGFFTATPEVGKSLGIRIGYLMCENNGVRGLHGRAEGGAGTFGINDVEIDTLELRRNGRIHLNHALPYDVANGGAFLQVAGVRRCNIKTLRATDEYGIAYQASGNDIGAAGFDSDNCSVSSAFIHNCGYGLDLSRGLKSHGFGTVRITSDRLYASAGFSVNINSISEISRPGIEVDWEEYWMVVGTVTLPAAWTAQQVAAIDAGDLITLSSASGAHSDGCVVVSVNTVARTAVVFCIVDPLGVATDNASGLITSVTPAAAGPIALNGVQTSAGTSNYAGARKIQISSPGNLSGRIFTVTGIGFDDQPYSEQLAGPNAATVQTKRLLKSVSSVTIDGPAGAALTVGTCISRPFTSTQANIAGAWRAGRGSAVGCNNNLAPAVCGDMENNHIAELYVEGQGGFGLLAKNVTARGGAATYKGLTFGKVTLKETHYGYRSNYCRDLQISQLILDTVGRGWGSDGQVLFEEANSQGLRVGTFTHRHDATKFTCAAEVINVLSTSSDVFIGPTKTDTTAAVHARFNGPNCVITRPINATTGAALTVANGGIAGTGSPVVWTPA